MRNDKNVIRILIFLVAALCGCTLTGHHGRGDSGVLPPEAQEAWQALITDTDEMKSPPVCLSRFSDRGLAANGPAFVNLPAGAIRRIVVDEHRGPVYIPATGADR